MKEFKGTKGEWKVSEEINGSERICIESESNDNFIDCWGLNLTTEDEMISNAKLIASAPVLLKALIELHNDLESWKYIHDDTKKLIKQAINKALK